VWKEDALALLGEGVAIEDIASPPYPVPPREATQVRILTAPNLEDHLSVVGGDYVESEALSPGAYDPIPIMVGEDVARLTGASVGDTFFMKPFSSIPSAFEWVEVAAIVTATEPTDTIWGIDAPDKIVYWDGPCLICGSACSPRIEVLTHGCVSQGIFLVSRPHRGGVSRSTATLLLSRTPRIAKQARPVPC
jgi:hypothetical protein